MQTIATSTIFGPWSKPLEMSGCSGVRSPVELRRELLELEARQAVEQPTSSPFHVHIAQSRPPSPSLSLQRSPVRSALGSARSCQSATRSPFARATKSARGQRSSRLRHSPTSSVSSTSRGTHSNLSGQEPGVPAAHEAAGAETAELAELHQLFDGRDSHVPRALVARATLSQDNLRAAASMREQRDERHALRVAALKEQHERVQQLRDGVDRTTPAAVVKREVHRRNALQAEELRMQQAARKEKRQSAWERHHEEVRCALATRRRPCVGRKRTAAAGCT